VRPPPILGGENLRFSGLEGGVGKGQPKFSHLQIIPIFFRTREVNSLGKGL